MSRARTRPTREQTRQRLVEAAARLFAEKGITAATIEDICDEAGFSRGAFYSNFSAKDELVLELLDQHLEFNLQEMERLFAMADDPAAFIASMESDERRRSDVVGTQSGQLYMELVLYAMRNPENRPRLVERQRRQREVTKQMILRIADTIDRPLPASADDVAALVATFDDGLLLHQMIDPESYRPGQFSETMLALHRLWSGEV